MENQLTIDDRKKQWDDALRNSPWFLMSRKRFAIIVMFLCIFTIAALAFGAYYLYLLEQGKLTPTVDIAPIFNPNVNVAGDNVTNQYDFRSTDNNDYKITVIVDMSKFECIGVKNVTG